MAFLGTRKDVDIHEKRHRQEAAEFAKICGISPLTAEAILYCQNRSSYHAGIGEKLIDMDKKGVPIPFKLIYQGLFVAEKAKLN